MFTHKSQEKSLVKPGRLFALDVGAKFIGCAISDSSQLLISPLPALLRKEGSFVFGALQRYLHHYQPVKILVGCPFLKQHVYGFSKKTALLTSDGKKIKAYAARIRRRFSSIPVELVDETLTTWEARTRYARLKLKKKPHAISLDSFAAMEIMRSYLTATRAF